MSKAYQTATPFLVPIEYWAKAQEKLFTMDYLLISLFFSLSSSPPPLLTLSMQNADPAPNEPSIFLLQTRSQASEI